MRRSSLAAALKLASPVEEALLGLLKAHGHLHSGADSVSEEIAREYATSDGVDRLLSGYVDDDFIHV